ncbi:hypothetical protein GQ53DRAFT_514224 [Thozetella sp. PMI_491]|nr:hypothetical protein GQ53DRAFT_514224 [Thozetella sp. PMI_491]
MPDSIDLCGGRRTATEAPPSNAVTHDGMSFASRLHDWLLGEIARSQRKAGPTPSHGCVHAMTTPRKRPQNPSHEVVLPGHPLSPTERLLSVHTASRNRVLTKVVRSTALDSTVPTWCTRRPMRSLTAGSSAQERIVASRCWHDRGCPRGRPGGGGRHGVERIRPRKLAIVLELPPREGRH